MPRLCLKVRRRGWVVEVLRITDESAELQVPPLRCASVGMTSVGRFFPLGFVSGMERNKALEGLRPSFSAHVR
jgi:hypothetical protein